MLAGESGMSLSMRMAQQAKNFGVKRALDSIVEARLSGDVKELVGRSDTYRGRTVIIASGADHRRQ